MSILKCKIHLIIVIAVAAIFGVVYSSFYFSLRPSAMDNDMWIFNTPDETANYFFIDKSVRDNNLKEFEALNLFSGELNLVHPRSTTVVDKYIVPGNFLGFILTMRLMAKAFTAAAVPFITPVISIFAVICFYFLIKEIFGEKIGFWSALALLALPAFWYYNARSLFGNILFIDFLIIGFYSLLRFFGKKNLINLALGSLLIGLALTIRTGDALWVAVLLFLVFFFQRRQVSWGYLLFAGFVIALAFMPIFGYQADLYGSPLATGYKPEGLEALAGGGNAWAALAKQFIAPFGIDFYHLIYNVYNFFAKMFFWYFGPAIAGAVLIIYHWFRRKLDPKIKAYFAVSAVVSVLVLIYYASWLVIDNVIFKGMVGSSQVRYFLPVYIVAIPLAVYFLNWLFSWVDNKKIKIVLGAILAMIFLGLSLNAVCFASEESLASVAKTVKSYQQINQTVRGLTEEGAVIISSYSDKLFFPKRKVIFYWREERFLQNIALIAKEAPVYFYDIDSGREIKFAEENSDLRFELVKQINEREGLYKLVVTRNP